MKVRKTTLLSGWYGFVLPERHGKPEQHQHKRRRRQRAVEELEEVLHELQRHG